MIKINLADKARTTTPSGGGGGGLAGGLTSFIKKPDAEQLKNLAPLRKVAIPAVVGFVASTLLDNYKQEELGKLDLQIQAKTQITQKLKADVAKYKEYEPIKESLDKDEQKITTKLETVRRLAVGRGSTLDLLTTVSNSIPQDAWLSFITAKKEVLELRGVAIGYGQISEFMKNLNNSSNVSSLELRNTSTQVKDETELAEFFLAGTRKVENIE